MNESDKAESHYFFEADRFDFTAALKKAFLRYSTTDDLVVEFDEDDAPYDPNKGGGFI
jgi:hypothetical protein